MRKVEVLWDLMTGMSRSEPRGKVALTGDGPRRPAPSPRAALAGQAHRFGVLRLEPGSLAGEGILEVSQASLSLGNQG